LWYCKSYRRYCNHCYYSRQCQGNFPVEHFSYITILEYYIWRASQQLL
jgi:hypothetical protein